MFEKKYLISIDDQSFVCQGEMTVLLAMKKQGLSYLPVGCCAGGCGICKVNVISGSYQTMIMSRAQVSVTEEQENIALACRILPESDLVIERFKS